jgi:hypothetical protein
MLARESGFEDAAAEDVRQQFLEGIDLEHGAQLIRIPPRSEAVRPIEEGEDAVGIAFEDEFIGAPRTDAVSVRDTFEGAWTEDKVFWGWRSPRHP